MIKVLHAIRHATRVITGRYNAGRQLTVFPDDLFLVSYPRSGNTWARFLIANLAHPNQVVTFANIESLVPEIYLFPDRVLRCLPRPRILKSHECFDPRYKKIFYIVRDPRDVALSYYHFHRKFRVINDDYPIPSYVDRFIAGEFGLHGCWGDHALSWLLMRQNSGNFLLLRYEDMLKNPVQELSKVASFLNLDATPEILARAVESSSAERMRNLEKKESRTWRVTRKARPDIPFVRSATSGGWRSGLPTAAVVAIEKAWGAQMKAFGYELVTEPFTRSRGLDLQPEWAPLLVPGHSKS